ncbi:MAG: homocysteine S-methyltransferase family protein [Fibrobacterota bacterium]
MSRAGFLEFVKDNRPVLSDGAMGTMLMRKGMAHGECPELWNETRPGPVGDVAAEYFKAGSDMVETNTFGSSPIKLSEFGLSEKAFELSRKGALIAREAAEKISGRQVFVAGSIGPLGKLLEPYGELSPDDAMENFRVQIEGLAAGGVDALCIETMISLEESLCALRAAKKSAPGLPVISTFTFGREGKGGFRTMMGEDVASIAESVFNEGGDIVGANCGHGIDTMVSVCAEFNEIVDKGKDKFIMVQANAGLPVVENGASVYKETPEVMSSKIGSLIESGADIIGGCCGTCPSHINAFSKIIRPMRS